MAAARPPARVSRQGFLAATALAVAGLVGVGAGLRALGGALSSASTGGGAPVDLGPLTAFPEGQFVVATFLSDAQAGEVSRRTAYVRNNGLLGKRSSFTILSSRCTHVGCPTQPNGPVFTRRLRVVDGATGEVSLAPTLPAAGFGCPCHGSQFDLEGNRTAGPAPRALDRYDFSIQNGRLWLGALYSVSHVDGAGARARIRRFGRHGAAEPVSGPESLLYPSDPLSSG
jgi:Rieske Fe-S protein